MNKLTNSSDLSPHEAQARILEQLANPKGSPYFDDDTIAALTAGAQALREEDGIRYDADSSTYVARHTILSAGRTEDEARLALASAVKLTAAHWPPATTETLPNISACPICGPECRC